MDGVKTKGSVSRKGRNISPFRIIHIGCCAERGTAIKRPLCVVVPEDTIQMSYAFDKRRGAVCKGKCAAGICFVPALQMLLHF
jgi:hypothetical protein